MATMTPEAARAFALGWINAWNQHDLEAVLAHYAEDFEFSSPLIADFAGEPSGTLRGKDAVKAYWAKGLARLPDLHFELIDVLAGVDSLMVYYRGHRGPAAEVFLFDASGYVKRGVALYGVS